ncbi:hypothetical protein GOV10_04115 [Candidatus Woesearchaeota archaeon]|nr:hypothetical protein [Candidatus Woesearchaeota archaeon]
MQPMMCPVWFLGFGLAFQVIFFLVTLVIALTGYQAYRFLHKEELKFHSIGFALLALSYLSLIVSSTSFIAYHIHGIVSVVAIHAHAFLFLAGIMVLLFSYLHIKDNATRGLLLLLTLAVITIFNRPTSPIQDLAFYLLTAAMIGFIVFQLAKQCACKHKNTTTLVLVGFILLFVGQIILAFATHAHTLFVVSTVINLSGFVSIAASRLMVK